MSPSREPAWLAWEQRNGWLNVGNFGVIWTKPWEDAAGHRGRVKIELIYGSHWQVTYYREGLKARVPTMDLAKYFSLASAMEAGDEWISLGGVKRARA
jgi:hypothetical protein